MKYNYTPELIDVLAALNAVRKTRGLANTPDKEPNAQFASVLRRAYLTALKADLLTLHCALTQWFWSDLEMEIPATSDEQLAAEEK